MATMPSPLPPQHPAILVPPLLRQPSSMLDPTKCKWGGLERCCLSGRTALAACFGPAKARLRLLEFAAGLLPGIGKIIPLERASTGMSKAAIYNMLS